ncbi:MAG TPA: alpha/beta hydrolase [Terracidiphilus sp.]|nr:alpha/beta hydrolase [Terracidiphilus sp.]
MRLKLKLLVHAGACLLMLPAIAAVHAQSAPQALSPVDRWAASASEDYLIFPDVTYGIANNTQLKLDVWQHKGNKEPAPTLIYYHGGGWIFGDRTGATMFFMPFIVRGWNVVNVEYRMASSSLAPAAVEDTRCAFRWVIRNAKQYNIDTKRVVLTGHSAGGHLALISGMLPEGSPLNNNCYGDEKLRPAAIINWFGPTDVNDLIEGPNLKNYARMWLGSQMNAENIAKEVSPLTYVRKDLPPIITIHGDVDPVVPYSQAVRLHEALNESGVPNELVTIKGGGHGGFKPMELEDAYTRIFTFLRMHGVME